MSNSELINISFDNDVKDLQEVSEITINNAITSFCKKSFQQTIINANSLIKSQINIQVDKNDKQSYELAKDLFYKHRTLWIQIKKDTDIIKKNIKPIIDSVQKYSNDIYEPLKSSGQKLKEKMLVYENEQERLKQEKKDRELAQQKREIELANMLLKFNTEFLMKIQSCSTIEDIDLIKDELNQYDISVFDEQTITATFQVAQLIATADMMRSNISMRSQQEEFIKQEQKRLEEKRKQEDEELKKYQDKIFQKLKQEEEERSKKLEILQKIKQEEDTFSGLSDDLSFDLKDDLDVLDNLSFDDSENNSEEQKTTYSDVLKEIFLNEIYWYDENHDSITQEQFATTLAIIVEKRKSLIFNI
jgi:hypothetical protein